MEFKYMSAQDIAFTVQSNTICFLNTYKMIREPKMRECIERNADIIAMCAEYNRPATIAALVDTVCNSENIVDHSLSTLLNLILYSALYHKAHSFDYATDTATVYLTARDGYYYVLKGVYNNGAYTWTYERRQAGR